jgi:hypothetical protein
MTDRVEMQDLWKLRALSAEASDAQTMAVMAGREAQAKAQALAEYRDEFAKTYDYDPKRGDLLHEDGRIERPVTGAGPKP